MQSTLLLDSALNAAYTLSHSHPFAGHRLDQLWEATEKTQTAALQAYSWNDQRKLLFPSVETRSLSLGESMLNDVVTDSKYVCVFLGERDMVYTIAEAK